MKRTLFLSLSISVAVLLSACNTSKPTDPNPNPNPNPTPITQTTGSVTVDLSLTGGASTSQIPWLGSTAVLELQQQSNRTFTSLDGKTRYSTIIFDVTCPKCSASEKAEKYLTFLTASTTDSVSATAFSAFSVDGQAASDAVAAQLAQAIRPSHGMTYTNPGQTLVVNDTQASFQAYKLTDLSTFLNNKTLANDVKLLPYGFRLLPSSRASSLGTLYLNFHVPTALPKISQLKLNMIAVADSQARDTETLAEHNNSKALARATQNNAKLTVLGSSPTKGAERICTLALSHNTPPLYLINESNCTPATLNTFVVDTAIDEYDGDFSAGDVSLREAIVQAPAGTTITFAPSLQGKIITLKSQENGGQGVITITKDINIDASSIGGITISGTESTKDDQGNVTIQGRTRLFLIKQGDVSFTSLTLQDAFLQGRVDISGEVLELGAAVDIAKGASLQVIQCAFKNNYSLGEGGAIHNRGSLTIKDSQFFSNKTEDYGGAIASKGDLHVENSYFVSNTANTYGGAIDTVKGGNIRIQNNIFLDNVAPRGGALAHYKGNLELYYNTIVSNITRNKGGGLYISSQAINDPEITDEVSVTLYGNIISGNFPIGLNNSFDDIYIDAPVATPAKHFKGGYNLLGLIDNQGYFKPQEEHNQGNLFNTNPNEFLYTGVEVEIKRNQEGKLMAIPSLKKFSLHSDSFALNTIPVGKALCGTTISKDALGEQRPAQGACNMGAVETNIERMVSIAYSSKPDAYTLVQFQGMFTIAVDNNLLTEDPIPANAPIFTHSEEGSIYVQGNIPLGAHSFAFSLRAPKGETSQVMCSNSDIYALELSLTRNIVKAHKIFSAKESYTDCQSDKDFATTTVDLDFSSGLNNLP